jgi:myo-inositol catabolism protein IolS
MKQTYLKKLDRSVSSYSLGTSLYGQVLPGSAEEEEFSQVISMALERGINFIDGARGYLGGRGEEFLGKKLQEDPLGSLAVTTTKIQLCGYKETFEEVETSLASLKRSCIEIMYIHWPRKGHDTRPMMEALEKCRSRGKIKMIGVSNFSVEQLEEVGEAGEIDMVQMGYNLLWRIHEKDLIPYCVKKGIPVTTYSSLAQGILSGKYQDPPPDRPGDNRDRSIFFVKENWPFIKEGVGEMKLLAEKEGCSLIELALGWLAEKEEILSVVFSARNRAQLDTVIKAAESDHSSVFNELTAISDKIIEKLPRQGNIFQHYP